MEERNMRRISHDNYTTRDSDRDKKLISPCTFCVRWNQKLTTVGEVLKMKPYTHFGLVEEWNLKAKLCLYLIKYHAMEMCGEVKV
jgi:hypothetical protein